MFTSNFADSRARVLGGLEAAAPARAGLGERIIKIDLIMLPLYFHYVSIILLSNLGSETFQQSTTNNHRPILDHHVTLKNLTLSLTLSLKLTLLDLDHDLNDLNPDLGLPRCQGTPTLPSTSDPP